VFLTTKLHYPGRHNCTAIALCQLSSPCTHLIVFPASPAADTSFQLLALRIADTQRDSQTALARAHTAAVAAQEHVKRRAAEAQAVVAAEVSEVKAMVEVRRVPAYSQGGRSTIESHCSGDGVCVRVCV
jgi:hypothetical protein